MSCACCRLVAPLQYTRPHNAAHQLATPGMSLTVYAPNGGWIKGAYIGHPSMCVDVQVWVEVQHCEERVQLLCTITRAVETHVSILQDELCKVCLMPPIHSIKPQKATCISCKATSSTRYPPLLHGPAPHSISGRPFCIS